MEINVLQKFCVITLYTVNSFLIICFKMKYSVSLFMEKLLNLIVKVRFFSENWLNV